MNKLESFMILARYMGGQVEQHYPFNMDYKQDGVLFNFRPRTVNEKTAETSPHPLFRNFSSASVKYHESFDWLMPVLQKVQREDFPNRSVPEVMSKLLEDRELSVFNLFENVTNYLFTTRPDLYTEQKEAK
jgi:hypothetical protein